MNGPKCDCGKGPDEQISTHETECAQRRFVQRLIAAQVAEAKTLIAPTMAQLQVAERIREHIYQDGLSKLTLMMRHPTESFALESAPAALDRFLRHIRAMDLSAVLRSGQ